MAATTVPAAARQLSPKEADIQMMLAVEVHLGTKNCDFQMERYVFKLRNDGKPTLFHGERSNIEEVIVKFAQLTPQERAKRKLESLEALKKTFMKLDHDLNIHDFLGANSQSIEEMTKEVSRFRAQLAEVHKRLSDRFVDLSPNSVEAMLKLDEDRLITGSENGLIR